MVGVRASQFMLNTAIWMIFKKLRDTCRAINKNILFQDSVYLLSFEQSSCVQAAYTLFPWCFDLFNSFSRSVRTATRDTSFRLAQLPFELYNHSLENTYICFLMWPPQHRNGNSNPVCFDRYGY